MMIPLGGQAVIEGVMIKSPNYIVTSLRDGKRIRTTHKRFLSLTKRIRILGTPFIRGIIIFGEMLKVGMDALNHSAEIAGKDDKAGKGEMIFATALAIIFGVGLFVVLPYGLTYVTGIPEETNPVLFNLVDGLIKLSVFILYVILIGMMKDIKRIFQYHGAEHKAVHCYEAGLKLTGRNMRRFSTVHLRCGTSFILTVMLVGIAIFSVIPAAVQVIWPGFFMMPAWQRIAAMTAVRLLALVPIMSISYEFLRFSASHENNILSKALSLPGSLTQKLTTKEPDRDQMEVAVAAVKRALQLERKS
jgi:uncharacterized protein YqhQ